MGIVVEVPIQLRGFTAHLDMVGAEGSRVSELLHNLESDYKGITEKIVLYGRVRDFVNIYVNLKDIRELRGMDTSLNTGDSVTIVLSVSGG